MLDRIPLLYKRNYYEKVKSIASGNLIAYWPLWEGSGDVAYDISGNGRNGAYTAVTLGSGGIGDGKTSALFDGSTSFCNVYSTSFVNAFNGAEGTISMWLQASSATVWAGASDLQILRFVADANNYTYNQFRAASDGLRCLYTAGATAKSVTLANVNSADWIHVAWTWSKTADQFIYYINGYQSGSNQTGLGTWAGTL